MYPQLYSLFFFFFSPQTIVTALSDHYVPAPGMSSSAFQLDGVGTSASHSLSWRRDLARRGRDREDWFSQMTGGLRCSSSFASTLIIHPLLYAC
jgi:hypothetical protein